MDNNKFDKLYFSYSISELLEKLVSHRTNTVLLDKEWYEALITHFSKRELTEEQKQKLNYILNTDSDILRNEVYSGRFKINDSNNIEDSTRNILNNENEKYPALRTVSIIYKIFAWVIGLAAIVIAILLMQAGQAGLIFAIISIVVGGLIVLGVMAIAESILVLIDIEHNTRIKK